MPSTTRRCDECQYEGNIPENWGRLTAEQMVQRFWETTTEGLYCGHGETFKDTKEIIWWAKGGVLHGQSPERIAFLKKILQDAPARRLGTTPRCAYRRQSWRVLPDYVEGQPTSYNLDLPQGVRFKAEVIDTWNMTTTSLDKELQGPVEIPLPGKPWQAIRLVKVP